MVTCNYEARRRGLKKLQLITEAKKIVPDLIIVLGEELGRFRDASKALYKYLESFTWSGKVEKLGFDEVFLDVTDIVDYNQKLLNRNDLEHSFFCLDQNDPTVGFAFDATSIAGHVYPPGPEAGTRQPRTVPITHSDTLTTRLILGSHFAQHLRLGLETEVGYTSTVGISTNKLLCKLVGNVNKPKAQTTLCPPYETAEDDAAGIVEDAEESNVTKFIDSHEVGKIPGIGFKTAQRLRNLVLSKPVAQDSANSHDWGGKTEHVSVRDVRLYPSMGPELLEMVLGGPGAERGIGGKIWGLLNGVDDTEVQKAKRIPTQISIEDSYSGGVDSMAQVWKELRILSTSLVNRMHADLLEDDDDGSASGRRWMAHPKTVRLSTRPRPTLQEDGTRSFNRISRSAPLPNFVFSLSAGVDATAEKLVQECLVPMFKRLHSPSSGWNLSLINIGVTNMVETGRDDSGAGGRDIGKMFRRQEDVLKEWKVEDKPVPPEPQAGHVNVSSTEPAGDGRAAEPSAGREAADHLMVGSEDTLQPTQESVDDLGWEEGDASIDSHEVCNICGAVMPAFALSAHERFHSMEEENR